MIIKHDALEIRETDIAFDTSPDTGTPECICSRCKALIEREEMPVRIWTRNKEGEVDENSKEYRLCELCLTGKRFFNCETFDEMGFRCDRQCDHCKKCYTPIS